MRVSYWILSLSMTVGMTAAASWVRAADSPKPVEVTLKNAKGDKVGTAVLTENGDTLSMMIEASKLSPGKHGIHFHENGKCEGPDFKSAGAHFNPGKKEHGLENSKGSHAGDLPNIDVKKDGTVKASITSHGATLAAGESSLLKEGGTAIVIHAKGDDQHSNPSGESGDRIACGVISAAH